MTKILLLPITFALLLLIGNIFAQDGGRAKIGIINGRATYLPKPDYPQNAEDFCADGKVEVEVLVDEKGKVVEAKAILGDELLQNPAVEAARKAKFAPTSEVPVKTRGIIIYNFVSERKCINAGIVNTKAVNLPKPPFPSMFTGKIKKMEIVVVRIIVDERGFVIYARSILGHPVLKQASEAAARQTKFSPILVDGGSSFKVNALLAYKFKYNGTIETHIEQDDKDVVGLPIKLVEPSPPSCNCRFGGNPSVIVQIEIDERGNVIKATAISGQPILKLSSEKAALESKFIPANIKTKKYIRYNFEAISKYSVKISSVEMMEIKTNK